jgi:hypothetical protein
MESFNSILIKVKWTKLKKKHVRKKIKIRKIILIRFIHQKEQEQKQSENGIFFLIVKDNIINMLSETFQFVKSVLFPLKIKIPLVYMCQNQDCKNHELYCFRQALDIDFKCPHDKCNYELICN